MPRIPAGVETPYSSNLNFKQMKKTNEKLVLTDWFSVLDALGGDITGDYTADCKRATNVEFSKELYEQAYQNSEQS